MDTLINTVNKNATATDTAFQVLKSKLEEMETKLNSTINENKSLKAKVDQLEKKIDGYEPKMKSIPKTVEEATDTAFQVMKSKLEEMETKLNSTINENKSLKAKVDQLEKKIDGYEPKMKSIPKTVEEVVTSGTLSFIPASFDLNNDQDEEHAANDDMIPSPARSIVYQTSNQTSPESNQSPQPDSVHTRKRKRISIKWSWKRDNPQGLAYLESLLPLPSFSRTMEFKEKTYEEGIKRNLWQKNSETFIKLCTKIDNMHKKIPFPHKNVTFPEIREEISSNIKFYEVGKGIG